MKALTNILLKNTATLLVAVVFFSCKNTLKEVQGLDTASYAPISVAENINT